MKNLSDINSSIRDLRIILRNSNERQSAFELSEIIKDTTDARAFIFLLDRFDTDKELTRETIEDLIEHTYNFNGLIIEHIQKIQSKETFDIDRFITFKNLKILLLIALFLGVTWGVANSKTILATVLNQVGIKIVEKDIVEDKDK